MFTSTASQGSGQETTIMTAVTQLAHHGMIYVSSGYVTSTPLVSVWAHVAPLSCPWLGRSASAVWQ